MNAVVLGNFDVTSDSINPYFQNTGWWYEFFTGDSLNVSDVNEMITSMVRHTGQKGYVYYPNIFGIRGPVILNDPQAIGAYFTELIKFAEQTAQTWIAKAKHMMWK